jgi:uncharacterized protein YkwD
MQINYRNIRSITLVCYLALMGTLASAQTLDSEESAFLTLINNYRAQNGVGPLQISAALENSSKWMSGDMAAKNYFSHTDSLGRDPGTRLAAFGYTFFPWGENLAAGYSDAQATLDQWINACDPDGSGACSFGHRRNMLNPSFQAIGIGRAFGSGSTYGWYWTTDFGGPVDRPQQSSPPAISQFAATPLTISPGQRSTLSWSVSGASSVSIDNGVGDVSDLTSTTVSPSQTTRYTITAINSAGAASAAVNVVVTSPVFGDTQGPTAPAIISVEPRSATEIDLSWTASTDDTGVSGYEIIRNDTMVASVSSGTLSWADNGVNPGTAYIYRVRAFDSAGNYSEASNAAQATTPVMPNGSACPGPSKNAFTGCYFNNTGLVGAPVLVNTSPTITFDWAWGFPSPPVHLDNFSVRWQGTFDFAQSAYLFNVLAAGGMRVYIDGALVLDRWYDQAAYTYRIRQALTAGSHVITLEYFDRADLAVAHLSWQATD